jgi:hypothetical protein
VLTVLVPAARFTEEYTMGSEKVPGLTVLHCDGRAYGNDNAYVITFKVATLRAHTPAIVGSTGEGFFGNPPGFGCYILFDVLHVYEACSLEAHSQRR